MILVRHRFYPKVWSEPRQVPLEHLQVLMDTANRHFSTHPERQLGGPVLPTEKK